VDVSHIEGLWLPLITPLADGAIDAVSLRRLIRHYLGEPIDGLILAATTGEGLTLDTGETRQLVDAAAAQADRKLPVFLGRSGTNTREVVRSIEASNNWPIDGYLVTCPSYVRPSQEGLYRHFGAAARGTDKPILVYNIPYRTGVNLSNDTLLRLAEVPNIVGVKDCCVDQAQSFDLLRGRPARFKVLTGEDTLFFTALANGADGGILAAAHVETGSFAAIRGAFAAGNWREALTRWRALVDLARLLFAEPNPAPIKQWLWRAGLIDSPELRLPMTEVSEQLARRIDAEMARRIALTPAPPLAVTGG